MGKIVFVGLCHLPTLFGTYGQFMERFLLLTMFVSFYGTAPRKSMIEMAFCDFPQKFWN